MLISVPNSSHYSNISEGDLIAMTKNDQFIGYVSVLSKTSGHVILDADKKVWRTFNELIGEAIPFDFNIVDHNSL